MGRGAKNAMERMVRRTRDRIETGRAAASSAEKRLDLSIKSRRAWSCVGWSCVQRPRLVLGY